MSCEELKNRIKKEFEKMVRREELEDRKREGRGR